jgi:hypothetical protein
LAASACGSVSPDAAVVNGKAIKVRDIEADVAALVDMGAQPGDPEAVTLPSAGMRRILTVEIIAEILRADLATKGVTVGTDAVQAADAALTAEGAFGPKWTSAPGDVRTRVNTAQATINVATDNAGGDAGFNTLLSTLTQGAKIKVNPRYGTWNPEPSTSGDFITALTPRLTDR